MTDKTRCAERVSDASGFHFHQCSRKGIVDRDGILYCRQHDPVARRERREKKLAESDAHWKLIQKREMHEYRCVQTIKNTAKRLGVDPVAFAEFCQNGQFLSDAILLCTDPFVRARYLDIKRAEPQS